MAKILITGGKGMLGRTLQRELADHDLFVADLPETDMLDADSLGRAFAAFRPELVIHCAAMTKVDDCETNRELAYRLNETGSANVATACRAAGARLIAISTDYVFAGDAPSDYAYAETDAPAPRTVYGASKLAGERAVLSILPEAVVLRIAWLYGAGGPSFVHTMAKLGAQDGAPLKVVDDQRGNPTSTVAVAGAVKFLLSHPEVRGVVHGTCEVLVVRPDLRAVPSAGVDARRDALYHGGVSAPRAASGQFGVGQERAACAGFCDAGLACGAGRFCREGVRGAGGVPCVGWGFGR